MGDLTPFLQSQDSKTVQAIYAYHKARGDAEPQRGYLGASILGEECERRLWYTFRGLAPEEFDGRMYRLFETGDLEEFRFVKELREIGVVVHDVGPDGEQFALEALGGHVSGHLDGVLENVPEAPKAAHLGEFKTHSAKNFAKLKREGVLKSFPKHYAQTQLYMGAYKLTRALYLARNKDTDELYSERIKFDRRAYEALLEKGARVVRSVQPPERIAKRQDDYRCKFCPAYALCWGVDRDGIEPAAAVPIPEVTCKSCCHATPETEREGAVWSCARYKTDVDPAVGAKCPSHLLLPGLILFAEPYEAGQDWIDLESRDGTRWRHGQGEGAFASAELASGRGPKDGPKRLPTVARPDPTHGAAVDTAAPPTGSGATTAGPASTPSTSRSEHVAWRCSPGDGYECTRAWCATHHGELFLCAVCGQAEAELEPTCPGPKCDGAPLLEIDFADLPLLARYPWEDSERVWDGEAEGLADAMQEHLKRTSAELLALEPKDYQVDEKVSAVEYRLPEGDYLVCFYKEDEQAAIWRGKE